MKNRPFDEPTWLDRGEAEAAEEPIAGPPRATGGEDREEPRPRPRGWLALPVVLIA